MDTTPEPAVEKVEPLLSRTICPLTSPVLEWTIWFDRDNPSGNGDYETLTELLNEGKPICKVPVAVNC